VLRRAERISTLEDNEKVDRGQKLGFRIVRSAIARWFAAQEGSQGRSGRDGTAAPAGGWRLRQRALNRRQRAPAAKAAAKK